MTIKLADVLDMIKDFADTDPFRVDWEIISDLVDQYLDMLDMQYIDEDYLPEEDTDLYTDREHYNRYGD